MMTLTRRQWWMLGLALAAIVLLTLLAAPNSGNLRRHGSTYSRSPDGYGAWYAFMQQRGTPVQRWQRSLQSLTNATHPAFQKPITLLRVSNRTSALSTDGLRDWVAQGNVLILLGVSEPVSDAPFRSLLSSPVGPIRVATSRRKLDRSSSVRLGDQFGAVVWQEPLGKGKIFYSTTPYLAANAYQTAIGNFEFLAQLVTEASHPVWVDEALHGYQDSTEDGSEQLQNPWVYLAKTPLLLLAIQTVAIAVVLVWGQNRRLGPPLQLANPPTDNSQAYIQAMAAVLHKADSSDFILDTVGQAEQMELQQALGLGSLPVSRQVLIAAWVQQTGQPAADLESVLQPMQSPRRMGELALKQWLEALQRVRRHLPRHGQARR